jgi:hypothetical protein
MHRIYRDGIRKNAWSHGNYIRPTFSAIWREAERRAALEGVSLSEFTSHALFVFMTGENPVGGKLRGQNVQEVRNVVHKGESSVHKRKD